MAVEVVLMSKLIETPGGYKVRRKPGSAAWFKREASKQLRQAERRAIRCGAETNADVPNVREASDWGEPWGA